jgi:hypothetical protein
MSERLDELVPIDQNLPVTPSIRYIAQETMQRRGFDPISRMIDLAEELEAMDEEIGQSVNADRRLKVYTTLSKYYAPQPKSVDVNITSQQNSTIQVISFKDLHSERQNLIPEAKDYIGPRLAGASEIIIDIVDNESVEDAS